jgi:hypothetical protein
VSGRRQRPWRADGGMQVGAGRLGADWKRQYPWWTTNEMWGGGAPAPTRCRSDQLTHNGQDEGGWGRRDERKAIPTLDF